MLLPLSAAGFLAAAAHRWPVSTVIFRKCFLLLLLHELQGRNTADGALAVPASAGGSQCTMPLHAAQRTALYDIRNVSARSAAGCCAACMAEPRCKYFEYETVTHPSRCWLKTSGAGPKRHD